MLLFLSVSFNFCICTYFTYDRLFICCLLILVSHFAVSPQLTLKIQIYSSSGSLFFPAHQSSFVVRRPQWANFHEVTDIEALPPCAEYSKLVTWVWTRSDYYHASTLFFNCWESKTNLSDTCRLLTETVMTKQLKDSD